MIETSKRKIETKIDWEPIRRAFIRRPTKPTYRALSEEFERRPEYICKVAKKQNWNIERDKFWQEVKNHYIALKIDHEELIALRICSKGHEEVCYEEPTCPVCFLNKEIEKLDDETIRLEGEKRKMMQREE